MKRAQVASGNGLQSVADAVNQRQDPRTPVEFSLMVLGPRPFRRDSYGRWHGHGSSHTGFGIRGNIPVTPGMELTVFLYLPDGKDPLFVMESRVAWASGRRFGVEILKMDLRERNRLRHFLCSNLAHSIRSIACCRETR